MPRGLGDGEVQPPRCRNGHQIVKAKESLRSWQGWDRERECGICGVTIGRHDLHFRCEHHCRYDICGPCMRRASHTAQTKAVLPSSRGGVDTVASQAQAGKMSSAFTSAAVASTTSVGDSCCSMAASAAMAVCLVAPLPLSAAGGLLTLLPDAAETGFPHPWMATGASLAFAWLLCRLASCGIGCSCPAVVEGLEVPKKISSIIGVLLGLEMGFTMQALGRQGPLSALPAPAGMLLAYVGGLLAGAERFASRGRRHLLAACGAALLGGAATTRCAADAGVWWQAALLEVGEPTQLCACAFAALRWVYTQSQLAPPDAAWRPAPLPVVRVACFYGAVVCLEVGFWFEGGGYTALLNPPGGLLRCGGLALVIGACIASLIIAETAVVQRSSAVFLGLLASIHGAAGLLPALLPALVAAFPGAPAQVPPLASVRLAAGVACGAASLLALALARRAASGESDGEDVEEWRPAARGAHAGYERLEAGRGAGGYYGQPMVVPWGSAGARSAGDYATHMPQNYAGRPGPEAAMPPLAPPQHPRMPMPPVLAASVQRGEKVSSTGKDPRSYEWL